MDKLKIIDCGNYYTVINTKGNYQNHCHVDRYSTAQMLCRLIKNQRVPDSDYLRESAKRVSIDWKYIEKIENKIEKDRDKKYYININKGVKK